MNLTVELDLGSLRRLTPESFASAGRGLWRFRALLLVERLRGWCRLPKTTRG
jgi:hypothetical protein